MERNNHGTITLFALEYGWPLLREICSPAGGVPVRLNLLLLCLLFSLSVPTGQILLKFAAQDLKVRLATSWLSACFSGWLAAAMLLYFTSMFLWLWLLNLMPLSRAYPFALLGAALVPVAAYVFIREPLPPSFLVGMALVIGGIAIIYLT